MPVVAFDRDEMARWYAREHLEVDPGIREVYYLPADAPEREIRLVEINELIVERLEEALEPLDFGVGRDADVEHTLLVLDVTPGQWERIQKQEVPLPSGWSLRGAVPYLKD